MAEKLDLYDWARVSPREANDALWLAHTGRAFDAAHDDLIAVSTLWDEAWDGLTHKGNGMRTPGLDRALAPVGAPNGTAANTAFWDHMWRFAKGAPESWWPHCIRRMWGRSLAPYDGLSIEELCALIHVARPGIDEEPTLAYVLIAATLYLKLENAEDTVIRAAIEKVRPTE